jgi:hypothetical protein
MQPEIKIEKITRVQKNQIFYSVWFWAGDLCEHIGHFETEYEAKKAAEKAQTIWDLARWTIKAAI